ncbi:hypothetical protein KAH81_04785 [bacterium]|nr:hypothetical protein [bacterium]
MLDRTIKAIKEADPKSLYDCIVSYCVATGCELPKNVETRIMLTLKLAEEGVSADADISILEIQEISDFVERAQKLREKQQRLIALKKFIKIYQ